MILKEEKFNYYFKLIVLLAIIFLIVGIFSYLNLYKQTVPLKTVSFSGEGEIYAIPDVFEINLSILTEGGKNLDVLQKENSTKTNKVIEFLKNNNIKKEDIKTIDYRIEPRYQYFNCLNKDICPPPEITGYSINQTLLVKIRDFEKISLILKGVVENGVNKINSLDFVVDDIEKYQKEARKLAIKNAKAKAKEIAKETGFSLGKVIAFNENFSTPYLPPYYKNLDSALGVGGGDMPVIEPGKEKIKVTVTLTYEIK